MEPNQNTSEPRKHFQRKTKKTPMSIQPKPKTNTKSISKSTSKENNFAFIDCQNIWVNKDRSWQLDWAKFREYLADTLIVKRAYLFIGFVSGYQKMYQQMQEAGFILIFKPVQDINGKKICNIDTEMVLQTMIQLPNFDKAVIVSGDGDFTCLVDHLRVLEKLKMLILPDHSYSLALEKCAREKVEFIGSLSPQIAKSTHHEDDIPTALIISD